MINKYSWELATRYAIKKQAMMDPHGIALVLNGF